MKMLTVDQFRLFYGLWLVLVIGGCSWGATPTPQPTPVPPPPGKLVFSTTHDGGRTREIYMMGTDGSNPINLTQSPTDDSQPAWAPDGRHIVFVSNRYRQEQLFIMDIATRETYRLKGPIAPGTNLDLLPSDREPAWSPDGQWIAYTSNIAGNKSDIYKIRSDGTEETQLTDHAAPDVQPAWSPDGRQIAFVSWRVSNPRESYLAPYEKNIFIMNADGTNVRRFTDDRETENEAPLWSQDGQWIAYHVMDGPGYSFTNKLILQNVATHEKRILRQSEYLGIISDQSPDGAWLVFDEWLYGDPNTKICFIQISGQNYQCLTPPGLQMPVIYARWQPMAAP